MAANSYRNVFLTNISGIAPAGIVSNQLPIGQIGIYNYKTNTSITTATFPAVRSIQILQGTNIKNLPAGVLYGDQTWRSPEIPADPTISFTALPAQQPQNMIVTLGFDGVDTTKTMAPLVGKQVRVYLTLFGQPVDNLLGGTGNHPAELTETFDLDLGCAPFCTNTCGNTVDCNVVADELINLVNQRKLPGGQLLSQYVKATKISQCTSPSAIPTTTCVTYGLTVADTGDDVALGIVQAQNPTLVGPGPLGITRTSYVAPYSTYSVTVCPSGLPNAYQSESSPVIPNCTTCPSGYTLNPELWLYSVQTTATSAATVRANYPAATGAFLIGQNGTNNIYEITLPTSANVSAVGTDVVQFIGTQQNTCVLTGPGITTPWTVTGTCYQTTQNYSISLADTVCGSNQLATLQSIYGSGVSILASGLCMHQYGLTVTTTTPSCETCDNQQWVSDPPAPFNGTFWTLVPGQQGGLPTPNEGSGCVCGVKFVSAYVARNRAECYFEDVSYEVEPLFLYVSSNNPDFRDYSTLCNDQETFPVTLIQQAQYAQGYGSFVGDQIKQSRFYFNDPWYHEPVVRDAFDYQLGVQLQGYYDQYILSWKLPIKNAGNVSGFGLSQYEEYEWHVYYPAGEGQAFAQTINSWLLSVGAAPASI